MRQLACIVLAGLLVVAPGLTHQSTLSKKTTSASEIRGLGNWLDAQGVERHVAVQDDTSVGGGRGLVATRRLEPGELAAFVPVSATLRLEGGLHDENDNWAGVMAANLLQQQEMGQASRLHPYLEFGLPKEAPLAPCRWSSRDRASLHNATLVEESWQNSVWRRQQAIIHTNSNYKSFMNMIDLVCSRTLRGRDGSRQMVPLIDMANHAPEEAGGGHFSVDEHGNVALIVGCRGVEEGQTVTMDYGARTVEDFLLHYGFVPNRCSSDSVRIENGDEALCLSWDDCEGYRGHRDVAVRGLCLKELQCYPTTLKDDLSFVRSMPLDVSESLQSALSYRIAKKTLLSCLAGDHNF